MIRNSLLLFAVMVSTAVLGCDRDNRDDKHREHDPHAKHESLESAQHSGHTDAPVASDGHDDDHDAEGGEDGHGAHEGHAGHGEHGGHGGHGEHGEQSDLDRSVSELFADSCEHSIKTHACDECRYEVGVVKAPARLFEGGLLKTATAETRKVADPLPLTGEVLFDQRRVAHLSTQAEGIIRKVHVTLGDSVTQGQALLEIDSVAIGEAQATFLEAQGLLALARRNRDRQSSLRQEGISSEKGLLLAQQEQDVAKIRADAAFGKLLRLGMSSGAARALTQSTATGKLVLRAPSTGKVLEMHAVAGEVAKSEEPLVTVGDNSAMWVWADLYERDVAVLMREQAKQALGATIAVKSFPDAVFPGTVDFLSPSMSKASRTVKIRIAVPNPSRQLLAGMFANVNVFLPGNEETLTVPRSAVLSDEERSFVFVHHQGEYYVRRPVTPGRSFASWVEILAGLSASETVVANGSFLLKSDVLRSKMGAGCAD